ncbi:hypothetical protein O1611_g2922 [Lasiodiplodia mahajangana]|uniref:Uncharacterized protein n=1 Tax=Lasiodiplodia mahajangana TaxID=1108764 RepID=A0ACC2JTP2_9PEZI|nr:hypothetical protein O1611_g2922 [Lasiodiplodia mahajangana]
MADSSILENLIELPCIYPLERYFRYLTFFASFRYPPLPSQGYIRLLYLHPSDTGSLRLEGCLRVQELDSECAYEAVSYSWGDYPELTRPLFLNGQVLPITENLYEALMVYRCRDRLRALWVDAVCINQADVAEKSQQVAAMADIYGKAKTVQVWLGPGVPWAKKAMDFMVNLSLRAESFRIKDDIGETRWYEDFPSLNISEDEADNLIRDAIKAHVDILLSMSWFNRVWVVQEVTLATELVVSCGNAEINWPDFDRTVEVLRGAYRELSSREEREKMEGTKSTWPLVSHRHNFRLLGKGGKRDHHFMTQISSVLMSNRDCSDDRDRIYAMLAMTTSPRTMKPDYSKTVAEVYTEFARRYSPHTQIYRAGLCRREFPRRTGKESNVTPIDISHRDYLPSWVPEFRPSLNLAWASPFQGAYSTARAAPYFFIPHPEMRSVISEPPWLTLAKVLTTGTSDCEGAERILSRYPYIRSLSYLQAGSLPWLTTIWERFATHCFSPTGEVFQRVLLETLGGEAKPLSPSAKIAFGFLNYVANILLHNRLFVTTKGYLGLAPRDVKPGDFIVVINGSHVPYVTRAAGKVKFREIEKEQEKAWKKVLLGADLFKERALQLIGPCYLQGIMKGEIFTQRDSPQFSHLEWTRWHDDPVDSLDGILTLV